MLKNKYKFITEAFNADFIANFSTIILTGALVSSFHCNISLVDSGKELLFSNRDFKTADDRKSKALILLMSQPDLEKSTRLLNASHGLLISNAYSTQTNTDGYLNISYAILNVTANMSESIMKDDQDTDHSGHMVIGVVLALFSFITIAGNMLVITAVSKEIYLRTVTNYFIVSLAVADLIIGGIVMPFAISMEMTNQMWLFGTEWCDLWRSFDVLASTASILNLCVISLDRYWAITDPIAYTTRMSTCKVCLLIAFVWLCSAGISFPAIAWWKAATPGPTPSDSCFFTTDSAYLIFSSIVSFYCPTIIMMFVYWRIYLAAAAQIRSLKSGTKNMTSNGASGIREVVTLRIHRGGGAMSRQQSDEYGQTYEKCAATESDDETLVLNGKRTSDSDSSNHRPAKFITKRLRQFALSKKLTKLAREQKAAKTLGIVVGVFILCWVPFFVMNILDAICHDSCVKHKSILFPLFTWLGYINSGMNPVIYALSMKDFRRAFGKILFVCCPKHKFRYRRTYKKKHCSNSTSSFVVSNHTDKR